MNNTHSRNKMIDIWYGAKLWYNIQTCMLCHDVSSAHLDSANFNG